MQSPAFAVRAAVCVLIVSAIGTASYRTASGTVLRRAGTFAADAAAEGSPAWNSSLGVPLAPGVTPQMDPAAVPDGLGGVLVAFEDRRGGTSDIYVQRLAADGSRITGWAATGQPVCRAEGEQYFPQIVADGSGGAFVVWEDYRGGRSAIFAQHISPDGRIVPGWPVDGMALCSAEYTQSNAGAASDGRGGLLVAWQDDRRGAPAIYVQRLAADGTIEIGWRTNGVPVAQWVASQELPRVISDGFGGAFVAWEDGRAGQVTAYVQRINGRGQRTIEWSPNGLAISPTIGKQDLVRVAPDGSGGAVLAWRDWRRGTPDLVAQRVHGDGTLSLAWPTTGVTLTSALGERDGLQLFPDGTGGFVAVWEDYRGASGSELYAQRISSDGRRPTGWSLQGIPVASGGTFEIGGTAVADGSGGVFCIWQGFASDGSHVHGQRLLGDGTRPPAWPAEGLRLTSAPAGQLAPRAVADASGGAIVVWEEGFASPEIRAARIGANGLHPSQIAVFDTDAQPDRLRVRWRSAPGASFRATIERSAPESDWTGVRSITPDASGEIAYEDTDVLQGGRYGYRIAVFRDEGLVRDGEVWLVVPASSPTLALRGFVPNPARHGLIVSFSLPASEKATLELLDVTGRRIRSRDVGTLGAGRHVVNLGGSVPPGFYLVRLSCAGQVLTSRGTVIR